MVRGIDPLCSQLRAGGRLTPLHGKVAVQFQHHRFRRDCVRTVDLDLVVVLRLRESKVSESQNNENE